MSATLHPFDKLQSEAAFKAYQTYGKGAIQLSSISETAHPTPSPYPSMPPCSIRAMISQRPTCAARLRTDKHISG
ncbi:hypothetical protein CHELA20_50332 [Hyphomicrobiales bacterium]|nr:hypothetical protein CHELA41_20042 [Hyphomicrobiales bacterium]CAH1668300.1 hypothetical protein CHELA20_50332 [Hyphomicrobiales bacterium]